VLDMRCFRVSRCWL